MRVKWLLGELIGDPFEVEIVSLSDNQHLLWQIRCHEHILPISERDPRTSQRYRRKFTTEVNLS